ncbi:hypothetical protein PSTG_05983 [Puccinia striiformis f. sp. tritici PST-78]|uniref:Rho-GAP domain-containing protein n=1 Tax=Puccinia striiformis f. sp. tritici PST-78 TaxID=1165861 RepID=A0A0L0VNJ7_9BASI|nr:hypothetical protein PSTG_05983 [Puccinia striiformis f. sp. tritici PST-78]
MASSLINNNPDHVPGIPRPSLRSRTSTLLPIPTRSSTSLSSSLRSRSHSSQSAHNPIPARPKDRNSNQKPHSYSLQPSVTVASVKSPSRLPRHQPSLPFNQAHTSNDEADDNRAHHSKSPSRTFKHTLRRTTISAVSINADKAPPFPTPLTSPLRSRRSATQLSATRNSLPRGLASRQPPPLRPNLIALQQARKVQSYQEYQEPLAAAVSRGTKNPSPQFDKGNASPQSLQSKITLTDDGLTLSVRNTLEYPPHQSYSSTPGSVTERPSRDFCSYDRPAHIHIPLQAIPSTVASSEYPEPQESQSRAYILERLQALIGTDEFHSLVDSDALYRLVSQSGLYETQTEIQERAFQEFGAPQSTPIIGGQNRPALSPISPGFDYSQTRQTPAVPHATLEAATHLIPPSAKLMPFESLATSPPEANFGPIPKQSNNLGNILLGKLGWKSKASNNQTSKHGTSKSVNKSLRPSSFTLTPSPKAKLSAQHSTSAKSSNPEQHRFSQIIGARLETMNCSTRVVLMGEQFHVLPVLPFNVIEELYRRGMRVPGIMRISGDLDRIDELVKKFESCPQTGVDVTSEDIHTLCGLLKHFLRTLPEPLFHPLLTHIFWKLCVEPSRTRQTEPAEDEHMLRIARYLLQLLPSRALSVLTYVIQFLAQIPSFVENRIQHDSLAVMLGPAIFVPREIGLPGLGLHPRGGHRQNPTTSAPASPLYTASFIEEVDKNAVSQRAVDSTLWLMNHSKLLFVAAHDIDRRDTEVAAQLKSQDMSQESVQSSLPGDQRAIPQRFSTQHPATVAPDQLSRSPRTSILTYTSGPTVSQRSIIYESSPDLSPSSSLRSYPLLTSGMNQLPGSSQARGPATDPEDSTLDPPSPSLSDDFPTRLNDQLDTTSNQALNGMAGGKEELNRSTGAVITYPKQTTDEIEKRDRRNSAKVIGLLTNYIEGREEKITQQESLIESLVVEIGRLQTVEEGEAALREEILKQAHIDRPVRKNNNDLERSLDTQKDFNSHPTLAVETSAGAPDKHTQYKDYHEQMFNYPSPGADRQTFALSEGSSPATANAKSQTAQSEVDSLSSEATSLDSPVDQTPDYRLSKNQVMGVGEEHAEEDAVEELHLGTPAWKKSTQVSPKRIKRTNKSIGTPLSLRDLSDRDPSSATGNEDDLIDLDENDSDQSNSASLRSEILRLKSLNSNLIRKLKSIESILGDISFP